MASDVIKQDKKDLEGEESEIDLGEKEKLMKNDKQHRT